MTFYSMSWQDALDLPLTTFWLLSRNIDRLRAETEIRQLQVQMAAQAPKGAQQAQKNLKREMGETVIERIDLRGGVSRLRKIMSRTK